jgi:hypothetical protein
MTDEKLTLLLEQSFDKLAKTEEIDSKISSEQSNTLNWILALTTLFVGICLQNYKNSSVYPFEGILYYEKILFAFSVIMLLLYKIIFNNYEKQKKSLLANLHTHKLELLFDLTIKLKPKLQPEPIFIPAFINSFRNGDFIPDYDKDRKEAFKKIDKNIHVFGVTLKVIYYSILIAFILNLTMTLIIIMNLNGC